MTPDTACVGLVADRRSKLLLSTCHVWKAPTPWIFDLTALEHDGQDRHHSLPPSSSPWITARHWVPGEHPLAPFLSIPLSLSIWNWWRPAATCGNCESLTTDWNLTPTTCYVLKTPTLWMMDSLPRTLMDTTPLSLPLLLFLSLLGPHRSP